MPRLIALFSLLWLSACGSVGVVDNHPLQGEPSSASYSIRGHSAGRGEDDVALLLAFSGGGTRAAALSYGVLQALRDTPVTIGGRSHRMLDEVDTISSVSGGSFTAAYYGLNGDRIFEDFEQRFLRRDVQGVLIRSLFNPLRWLSPTGRTERAVQYYQDELFEGATFADLAKAGGPLIMINASDLAYGVRFSFVQEFFRLLCSDIAEFPVARAVTASSAVPVLFNPVLLRNYSSCDIDDPELLMAAEKRALQDPQLALVVDGVKSYFDNDRSYVHLVDGGITDNLGLRGIYDIVEISGGLEAFMDRLGRSRPRHLVIISVNAAIDQDRRMDETANAPSLEETIGAVTDTQLHQYNAATLNLMRHVVDRWAEKMSTPQRPVEPYFIALSFRDFKQAEQRAFFNRVPTNFSLSDQQIDKLIAAGHELLRENPDFQRFVSNLSGTR